MDKMTRRDFEALETFVSTFNTGAKAPTKEETNNMARWLKLVLPNSDAKGFVPSLRALREEHNKVSRFVNAVDAFCRRNVGCTDYRTGIPTYRLPWIKHKVRQMPCIEIVGVSDETHTTVCIGFGSDF